MESRLERGVQTIDQNWHRPIDVQWQKLCEKVRGHYAYYGIRGNLHSLEVFLQRVQCVWYQWLNRRGNRRRMTWEEHKLFLKHYPLPAPVIVHDGTGRKRRKRKSHKHNKTPKACVGTDHRRPDGASDEHIKRGHPCPIVPMVKTRDSGLPEERGVTEGYDVQSVETWKTLKR